MKKVTGIGGVILKCKDSQKMNDWYKTHLGINAVEAGAIFNWVEMDENAKPASTTWSMVDENSDVFRLTNADYLITYRVSDLETLLVTLKSQGVSILDNISTFAYGKQVHILDGEGNKIQLWQAAE
ncbi:MAG: VOC family protein [Bacteroidia bacterium]|nr:VOC family protein [Bacteroidia bacterium]